MNPFCKFSAKRQAVQQVAQLYKEIHYKPQSEALSKCATFLQVEVCPRDGFYRLRQAYFCKQRHCPLCMWKNAATNARKLYLAMEGALREESKCRFLFLTLTCRNVSSKELSDTITRLSKSFARGLLRAKVVKQNLLGSFRSIECTYNEQREDFHPHIHALLCVQPEYFKRGNYLSFEDWLDHWRRAFQDDGITSLNVQAIRQKNFKKAAFELAKYAVKTSDIKCSKLLKVVHDSFHNRRFLSSSGLLKKQLSTVSKNEYKNVENDYVCGECGGPLENSFLEFEEGFYRYAAPENEPNQKN